MNTWVRAEIQKGESFFPLSLCWVWIEVKRVVFWVVLAFCGLTAKFGLVGGLGFAACCKFEFEKRCWILARLGGGLPRNLDILPRQVT